MLIKRCLKEEMEVAKNITDEGGCQSDKRCLPHAHKHSTDQQAPEPCTKTM